MIGTSFAQRSETWFQIRCGRVTASRVADLSTRTKTGWGASRANYISQLVTERLTGIVEPSFHNAAISWGIQKESEAREAYAALNGAEVGEIAFVLHPDIFMAGASPDGLVGELGLLEIKCPNSATHMTTLSSGQIPEKYQSQMLWQMACTGRQWCDFVSYDPRFPEPLRLFKKRFERDDDRISELENLVRTFLIEVDDVVRRLNAECGELQICGTH